MDPDTYGTPHPRKECFPQGTNGLSAPSAPRAGWSGIYLEPGAGEDQRELRVSGSINLQLDGHLKLFPFLTLDNTKKATQPPSITCCKHHTHPSSREDLGSSHLGPSILWVASTDHCAEGRLLESAGGTTWQGFMVLPLAAVPCSYIGRYFVFTPQSPNFSIHVCEIGSLL